MALFWPNGGVVQSVRTWAAEARRRVEQCGTASHAMARDRTTTCAHLHKCNVHVAS
ncbi:hypothetical protein GALMADRAFT_876041 [Galerina marginata CBS 339.88]|uniref:Uncharacterized protein n=1 Tax=Galerina marginata (strain CBS 339.88) TaxID=685588 RepID=A0A067TJ30_GALM3|nr:hypothetical protein GALMADRAFT_876041 [Galerina marginata CBS 339.88]